MIVQREQYLQSRDRREAVPTTRAISTTLEAAKILPKAPPDGSLEVVVMFTDVPGTLKALKTAAELAHNLSGRIRLIAPQVVPYPLRLESPPVSKNFNERRFQTLASQGSIDTRVELCLCRDREAALCQALEPEALVVIGARRSWLRNAEKALATKLRKKGHHVILVDSERSK
jgi:hypothetical protein